MRRMKKTGFTVAAALVVSLALGPRGLVHAQSQELTEAQRRALAAITDRLSYLNFERTAVPSWLMGDLGPASGDPGAAALDVVRRLGDIYRMSGADGFTVRKTERDEIGQVHARLQQRYGGIRVVDGELIVHMEADKAVGINGHYVPDLALSTQPGLTAEDALSRAERVLTTGAATALTEPELVVFEAAPEPRLAWTRSDSYVDADGDPQIDVVFADANTGALLAHRTQIWTARNRQVYDGTGICLGVLGPALPGPLLISEGQVFLPNDDSAQDAYHGTGKTWDFYRYVMNRDSYDGAGATLKSSVHVEFYSSQFGCHGNNAQWRTASQQMVYGGGDGVHFSHLSGDNDVTAHELTHALTEHTANLAYSYESGGLNEAMSDIMGESVDTFQGCVSWKIGEDVYTPSVPGDALRYMYNPTLDGKSFDYYPDYLNSSFGPPPHCPSPNDDNDNCGVHRSSGIANLAFNLISMGGTHPQGKTQVVVPEIGIDIARKVFYRALTFYMTSTTGFSGAREATVQAAQSLFPCADLKAGVVDAIRAGWEAVGVPEVNNNLWPLVSPGPGPVSPCLVLPDTIELFNNTGFESGPVVWSGTSGVVTNSLQQPNWGGSWKAWLGGDGVTRTETLRQRVHIPAIATSATLTFRMHVNTAENGGVHDTLSVIKTGGCGFVEPPPVTLATWSNLNAGPGFVLKTVNLTPYIGHSILLSFTSSENASLQTSFVLDAMSVAVK
jgi:Zn-dependent metalloprotease